MAHSKASLESLLKSRQALQVKTADLDKQETQALATLNRHLQALGFQIERIEPTAPRPAKAGRPRRRQRRRSALRCTVARCGRTFHYPMHLGRHLRTVHGQKG